MLVSFFVLLFDFNSFTLITWQRGSDLPQYEGYIHRYLEMSYLQLIISHQMRSYSTIKAISKHRGLPVLGILRQSGENRPILPNSWFS